MSDADSVNLVAASRRFRYLRAMIARTLVVVFSLCVTIAGCTQLTQPISRVNFVSVDQERQLGGQFAGQVEAEQRVVTDTRITEYVQSLGERLASGISSPEFRYTFRVVNDPSINAFNIGGGYVYVHTGLLQNAGTEGQLASVLAHEIGHQVARHVAKAISRQQLFQTVATLAAGEKANALVQLAAGLGVTTGQLYFGREAEREADRVMVDLMIRAEYDPRQALDMFERLKAVGRGEPGTVGRLLSSHPPTSDRIRDVTASIEERKPPAGLFKDSRRFQEVRSILGEPAPSQRGASWAPEAERRATVPF